VTVIPRQRIHHTVATGVVNTLPRSNSCVSWQPRSTSGSAFLRSSFPNFGSIGAQGVVSLAAQLSSRAPSHPIRFAKRIKRNDCYFSLLPSVLFRSAARIEKRWVEPIKLRQKLCGGLCVIAGVASEITLFSTCRRLCWQMEYQCDSCASSFRLPGHLQRHLNSWPLVAGERQCPKKWGLRPDLAAAAAAET